MGEDKCFLNYHGKAQCYHVYEMLQQFCEETFISCNADQSGSIDKEFKTVEDIDAFADKGPATGVLSAFSTHPQKDLLIIACDYPLLTQDEIRNFLENIPPGSIAAAFYDEQAQSYQPVLAWYSCEAGTHLMKSSENEEFSLKRFLESVNAYKYIPLNPLSMKSIDTEDERERVMQLTNNNH